MLRCSPATVVFLLSALAAPAIGDVDNDAWLYAPAPTAHATTILEPRATAGPTAAPAAETKRIPSSDRSKLAWINQSDWMGQRLGEKGLRIGSRIHIRIFKLSRELELYVHSGSRFELFRTYPICDVSGTLGPKRFEGDLQAPEGLYTVVAERLHPHSDFHLAFNLGYPNEFDRSLGRTGGNIMIHGGCASVGCFAVTDYYMEQIYLMAEAALAEGQSEIGVEIYPFRMTDENLTAHSQSRWAGFWSSLKPIHDHFTESGLPATTRPAGPNDQLGMSDTEPSIRIGRLPARVSE